MTNRIVLVDEVDLNVPGTRFETVEVRSNGTPLPEGDCYVVAAGDYPTVRARLVAARTEDRVPTVLVVADDAAPLAGDLGTVIDDIIPVDASAALVDHRLSVLTEEKRAPTLRNGGDLELARRALESASTGVVITDPRQPDNPVVFANSEFEALTGYTEAESVGRNCRWLQGPGTDPEAVRALRRAIADEQAVTVELLNYRKDGAPFWNRVTILPIYDGAGTLSHFLGFQEDITGRREREAVHERYERIVHATTDPIFALDAVGRVTLANDAFVEALGVPRAELVGAPIADYFDDDTVARARDAIRRALADGTAIYDADYATSDGRHHRYEVSLVPLVDDGTFVGTVQVCRDMTAVHEYERRLSVFDRILRHNLRNKMNIVIAATEEVERTTGDPEIHEKTTGITAAAEALLSMADDIRRFRAELDPTNPTTQVCDLVEHVETVLRELAVTQPNVTIETTLPEEAWVRGPAAVELIITELIENALVHGEPPVEVRVESDAGTVRLSVIDHGEGVPSLERRALERGAETPLEHTQGVGLWLVRWAAENAGGSLAIDDDGDRTVVSLTLPVASPEERP